MPNAEHRESGINLFKQRCVQKCHSHGEVCQQALKVWWVRASSRVCCHGIKHWVCPVWFEELLFLNGLVCQHVQIPLRGQNKELSRHYSVGIFLSASNDCVRWEKVWDNWNRENVICWRKYNRNGPVLCPVPNLLQASLCQNPKVNMFRDSAFLEAAACFDTRCPNTYNIYTGQDHQRLCAFTPPISQHITLHICKS